MQKKIISTKQGPEQFEDILDLIVPSDICDQHQRNKTSLERILKELLEQEEELKLKPCPHKAKELVKQYYTLVRKHLSQALQKKALDFIDRIQKYFETIFYSQRQGILESIYLLHTSFSEPFEDIKHTLKDNIEKTKQDLNLSEAPNKSEIRKLVKMLESVAVGLKEKNRPDLAFLYFSEALSYDPGNSISHYQIGNIYLELAQAIFNAKPYITQEDLAECLDFLYISSRHFFYARQTCRKEMSKKTESPEKTLATKIEGAAEHVKDHISEIEDYIQSKHENAAKILDIFKNELDGLGDMLNKTPIKSETKKHKASRSRLTLLNKLKEIYREIKDMLSKESEMLNIEILINRIYLIIKSREFHQIRKSLIESMSVEQA